MRRYLTYSLAFHGAILVALVILTYALPSRGTQKLRFVVLPKGTSLDSVLTPELAAQIASAQSSPEPGPPAPSPAATQGPTPAPTEEAGPTPAPTPATPAPTAPAEKTIVATPRPTPTVAPAATARPTPTPQKTIAVTPKQKTPTPSPRPTRTATPRPRRSPTPSPRAARPTPKASPKSTRVASAYAADSGQGGSTAGLPQRLPAGVTPRRAAPGEEVGVPGVPEGVEGAPLPLDREQSLLSMLYATRARMKIQSNFTVPPDVNDPNITCVVEWEIEPDGTVSNVRVAKSTGVARLDACAVDALRKTANLGPLPPEWGNRPVWTSLTFVFAGDLPVSVAPPAEPDSADPRRR